MKKYKEYMDGVKASDTLHQRLLELETPAKRPAWKRYGPMAAALAVAVGLGAWGLNQYGAWERLPGQYSPLMSEENSVVQPGRSGTPDIAAEDPGERDEPQEKTIGGYEVRGAEDGPNTLVTYYVLPYIKYGSGEVSAASVADWGLPDGAVQQDVGRSDIAALFGGEDTLSIHLDWDSYELSGWAAWDQDGAFWGAYLSGHEGPLDHFEFVVTAGQMPPACVEYAGSASVAVNEVRGLTVLAEGHDSVAGPEGGVDASTRRVSFMKDGYGCRFDITGVSRALTEERVSRLVSWIAANGVGGLDGDTAPAVSANPDICRLPLAPSADPNDAMCSGYPVADPEDGSPIDTVGSIDTAMHQSSPPTLRVLCSEGLVEGRSGNYQWSCTDPDTGITGTAVACGLHPLDFRDAPSLTTADETVVLNFFDLPGQVQVNCWPDSEWGSTSAASQTAQADRGDQTYTLTLNDGGWIYEINAQWDGQGSASYVFCLVRES